MLLVRKDLLKELFEPVATAITSQFSEREALIRSDMFRTMSVLVKETVEMDSTDGGDSDGLPTLSRQNSLGNLFMTQVANVVWTSALQFASSDLQAKTAIVELYEQIILSTAASDTAALIENFDQYYDETGVGHEGIITQLQFGLASTGDEAVPLAAASLSCLKNFFKLIDYSYFEPFIMSLLENIAGCIPVGSLTADALACLSEVIIKLAPSCDEANVIWIVDCIVLVF